MSDFETEMLNMFLDEATESLEAWERSCLALGKDSQSDADAVAQLFRCAHNMKGSSKSVGLAKLGHFIHDIEEVILKLKNLTLAVNPDIVQLLLDSEEALHTWLTALRNDVAFVLDTSDMSDRLSMVAFGINKKPVAIGDIIAPVAQKTNNKKQEIVSELQAMGDGDIIFDMDLLANIQAHTKAKIAAPLVASETTPDATAATSEVPTTPPAASNTPKAPATNTETIRVPTNRIDSLIQLVGELSIQTAIIGHARQHNTLSNTVALDAMDLLGKITRELQTASLGFRMQTVQATMQRLERVARDAARDLNKNIEIVTDGNGVELDKTVLERMIDPLVHMVRNSLDHGIESSEDRIAANKPAQAILGLSAVQAPDGVTLIVSDDGKGLDTAKILAKAKSNGLIAEDAVLSEQEIFNLIFQQGFSTAEKVTSISGRGVGMEVVQRTVAELGGRIHIESKFGKGSKFSITLPSSVSIVDALLVCIDNNRYAVPVTQVEEILNQSDVNLENALDNQVMFRLRQEILPLQDLRGSMTLTESYSSLNNVKLLNKANKNSTILVVRYKTKRLGLAVDTVAGQQQIVVRKLTGVLEDIAGFVGGTILGDGEPGFILDVPFWANRYFESFKGAA